MSTITVGLIPARGGSQGVPRKNLALVGSRTLLRRAIDSALMTDRIQMCFVSSDDAEILREAERAGAIPHQRAKISAMHSARAGEVVQDFLSKHPDFLDDTAIAYLQPTSPFRTSEQVAAAIQLYEESSNESVVSVMRCHQFPEKTLAILPSGILAPGPHSINPGTNRQEFTQTLYPNGAIYIFSIRLFHRYGDVPVFGASPFLMNKLESMDIDDLEDLMIAQGVAAYAGI